MHRAGPGLAVALVPLALAVACSTASAPATPAAPSPDCSAVSVTPTNQAFPGGGGTGAVSVTVPAGCGWSATASAPWITFTSGAVASGPASLGFAVARNPALVPRSGTIAVNGVLAGVSQAETPNDASCRFSLQPQARAIAAAGGVITVEVSAPAGCRWEATGLAPWVTVQAPAAAGVSGGSGAVEVRVAANPDGAPRSGQAAIAGQTFEVSQDGASTPACAYDLAPPSRTVGATGAVPTLAITTGPACSWSIETDAASRDWLSIAAPAAGAGSAVVSYAVAPNYTLSSRAGAVILRGDSGNARLTHAVSQVGAGCVYTATPVQMTFAPGGTAPGVASVRITTQPGDCTWTASSTVPWATITAPGPGQTRTGAATITFVVAENATGAARTGEIRASGLSGLNPPARLQLTQATR